MLDKAIQEASVIQPDSAVVLDKKPEPVAVWTQAMITEFCKEIAATGQNVPLVVKMLFGGNLCNVNPQEARDRWEAYRKNKAA